MLCCLIIFVTFKKKPCSVHSIIDNCMIFVYYLSSKSILIQLKVLASSHNHWHVLYLLSFLITLKCVAVTSYLSNFSGFLVCIGIWSPSTTPQPVRREFSSAADFRSEPSLAHSTPNTPSAERREFRSVKFESPILLRKTLVKICLVLEERTR